MQYNNSGRRMPSKLIRLMDAARWLVCVGAVGAVGLATGCGATEETGSLGSESQLIACAETAAWAETESTTSGRQGNIQVTMRVSEWLVPEYGRGNTLEFPADDPSVNQGAPAWQRGSRVLVIIGDGSPPNAYPPDEGMRIEQAWRDAGAPTLSSDNCRGS